MSERLIEALLASPEPSLRWKVRTRVLGEAADAKAIVALRKEIKRSPRVARLLAGRDAGGRLVTKGGVYAKWQGAHWVLAALADLGYPPGDPELHPLRGQVLDTWLKSLYYTEFVASSSQSSYRRQGVPIVDGRFRRCGSQQGNALWYLTTLGFTKGRTGDLAERLRHWQWPDGGWNCDRHPAADTSSFMETWLPLRGLAAFADATGDTEARAAALRAAEVFLTRRMLYRASTGEIITKEFAQLHYPLYWHYDVLGGLKVMAEAGLIGDSRCHDAVDLLESMRLTDGWPAHRGYYRLSAGAAGSQEKVDWGGTGIRHANPWVTADALAVLRAAGRL
jgi:hypothetical protein